MPNKFRHDKDNAKKGGWNNAPEYTPQGNFWRDQLVVIIILAIGAAVGLLAAFKAKAQTPNIPTEITSIYWSDADSGSINGSLKFRLNIIDAPETGGVGAAIGGAECELERERGYEAKDWIVSLTRDAELSITKEYGLDKYDRHVVDLSASGEDIGRAGIDAGHLKPWPHKGRRALADKPDWCNN